MGAPSQNHPWRQYANRQTHKENGGGYSASSSRPLRAFLTEILENWYKMELPVRYRGRFDKYTLMELPDKLVANWLIGMLRRYNGYEKDVEEEIVNETGAREAGQV